MSKEAVIPQNTKKKIFKRYSNINKPLIMQDSVGYDSGFSSVSTKGVGRDITPVNAALLSSGSTRARSSTDDTAPASPEDNGKRLYQGRAEDFLLTNMNPDWLKWNPVEDIRECLDHVKLETIRNILWEKEENDEDQEL